MPHLPHLGTRIASLYRIKGIPAMCCVGLTGRLRGVSVGLSSEDELRQRYEARLVE